jgi:hypothetical protein
MSPMKILHYYNNNRVSNILLRKICYVTVLDSDVSKNLSKNSIPNSNSECTLYGGPTPIGYGDYFPSRCAHLRMIAVAVCIEAVFKVKVAIRFLLAVRADPSPSVV